MAIPSYKALFDDPRFQNASVEEQNRINSEYWADYDKENPNDPWAQQMRTATYGLIGTKKALASAPPIKQRELSLQKDAFEFSTKLGAVDKENLWESPEQRTQIVSQMQSEFEKRKAEIDKTTSLFRDPKVDEAMQPAWQALTSSASMGEVFEAPDTWDDTALKGVSYVASGGGSSERRDKARADYEKYRSTLATDFGLSTDEVDDLVKHRLGKQADQVSQDVAGTIHFRDDLLIKPVSEIESAVEQSKLPESVKSLARTEAPQKIALFKTGVLNRVKKDYPELADDMTWTGKTDEDYATLQGKLNKDWVEQLGGGVQSAGLSGLFAKVPSYAIAPQPGVVPVQSSSQIKTEIERQRELDATAKKQQAVNELSSFINQDKTKILGTDAATVGQGLYSMGESVLLGAATGGLGTAVISADRIAKAGKVGKALLGFSKGALNTAPVAGIYGAQQGFQTYEQALASDDPNVRANAANLALGSAAIGFGVTTVFGGIGLGGTEDYASKLASPALRKEAAMTIGKAWKNLAKNAGEAVVGEVPEEALITALDSVHVQQKLNPQMTDAEVRKAIYDTVVSTALTTAPLGGIKAAKEGLKDFSNITTHDRSTDELKREADNLTKASAQESLSEEAAQRRNEPPPSAERVAELGTERTQLEERLKKTPPGGQPWLDLKERILEINQLIGEPTKVNEQNQPSPAGESNAPQALQLSPVSTGPTAPAGSEPAGGNPQGTGPTEAQAQAPLETSPAPTGTPTETLPAGQAAPSGEGAAPVAPTTPTNEEKRQGQGREVQAQGQVLNPAEAPPAQAGGAVDSHKENRQSLDQRAKDLGYDSISQFNAQNVISGGKTEAEKQLLKDYGDHNSAVRAETNPEAIAAMSDEDYNSWQKTNLEVLSNDNPLNRKEQLSRVEQGMQAARLRGDEKTEERLNTRLGEAEKRTNYTVEELNKDLAPDEEPSTQADADALNANNKEFNNALAKTKQKLSEQTDPTPQTNATQKGEIQQGNLGEYPQGNEARKTAETGSGNSPVSSGQEQVQAPFQTLTAEQIKAEAPHLPDEVAEMSALLFNTVAPDIQKPLKVVGQPAAPKMTQGELFQQDTPDQGLPQARTFVQSFQGTPPKGATRALIDYAGDPLLSGGDLGDLPAHTVKDIQEADQLIQNASGKGGRVRVGRLRFNDFLTKLWKRHHRGKKPGWHNFRSARDIREMGRILAFEIGHALTKDGSGVDWYRSKIDGMYRVLSSEFPELAQDGEDRFLFSVILAVTSNGQSVPDNLYDALLIYDSVRGTGKLPAKAHTSRSERNAAVVKAFREVNSLIAENGWEGAKQALLERMTVSQLQKRFGIKLAGELADHNVIGAMILGPKIGSFWGNLNGHYDSVTMDLWFTRTMNRLSGDTATVDPQAVTTAIESLKALPDLPADVKADIKAWEKARAKNEAWTRVPSDIREEVEFLYDYVKNIYRQYAGSGFKDRNDLNKTAQKIVKAIDGGEDTPDNGTHRKWMRDVIDQAQKQLQQNGINITNADLQAILWFHEKDLYTRFGATTTRGERTDYQLAAGPALQRARTGIANRGELSTASDAGRSSGTSAGQVREVGLLDVPKETRAQLEARLKREREQGVSTLKQEDTAADAEYLAAVEAGDMETAQRMVDEAAKAAGYNVGPVWHGTNADFNTFNPRPSNKNRPHHHPSRVMGMFFTNRKKVAESYAKGAASKTGSKRTIPAYIRLNNPKEFKLTEFYDLYDGFRNNDWKAKEKKAGADAQRFKQEGHDGIIVDGGYEIIVFDPSQIKSADPVTRDDAGNVIPLSQRFNPSKDSILYQGEQPRVTRGSITFAADMGKAWITLMQHANASTFPHELAHFLRRFVLADSPEARMAAGRRGISVEEVQNLAKWAGVGADGVWTRAAEEKFARGFERYLAEGKAPTPQLQALFDKFSTWLKEIYGAIAGSNIDIQISPEAKAVFDKLLAGPAPATKPAPAAKPAAKPATKQPTTPSNEFSAKREYMDALRRKYGFAQYYPGDPVTDQMVTDEAAQALDNVRNGRPSKYKVGQDLVNELEGRSEPADAVEIALLVHEAKVLDTKLTRAYAGIENASNERQSNSLSASIAEMEEQLNVIASIVSERGTAAGRMLQSFKKVWDNKFDLVRMTAAYLRDKRAATGDPKATVSPDERKKIREINTKLKEKKKAFDDAVAAREKEVRAKQAKGVVDALAKDVRDKKAPAKQRVRDQLRAAFDVKSAAERLRARGFGARLEQSSTTLLQSELDPEILDDLATVGAGLILDHKLENLDDFTAAIVHEFGPEAMDYASEIYQRAQDKIEAARKSRKIPKSPEQLLKEVDPEKELSNRMVFNMVRGYLLQGMDKDQVLRQVHKDLQTVWEDITFEEVSDAFTGYGKIKYPSTEEINVQLRELRNIERIKRQLDVVRAKQVPSKTGFQRDKPTPEIRALQKELKAAMKAAGIKTTRSNQLKSSLDAIKTRFRNELEDLQRAIDTRTALPPKKDKEEYDKETADLKTRVDAKRAEYAAIFEDKTLTEKQQLAQALAAINRSIAEEEDMLAKGILNKPKRDKRVFDDPEFKAAEARLTALREARHTAQRALKPKKSAEQIALEAAIREARKGITRDEERVRTGNVDPVERKQRYTPNDELKDLLAERASLKQIIKLQRQQKARLGKPARDAARQEQRAAEAIERSMEKIEKRIEELSRGVVTPVRRVLPFTTPGLSAARAVRDSRRRTMQEMEKALKVTKSAEQLREERQIKAANAKKLRYQEMIDKGILTKPVRVSAPVTEAVDKARYEAALVEAEWNKLRSKMLWENRTIPSKVWSRLKTGLRATSVLRLSGDYSLLRQGGVWALSNFWLHPFKTASTLARVARHGMTERGAYEIYQASQEALNTAGFTEKDIRLLNPIEPPGTAGRSRAAEEITGADILDMAAKLPKKTVVGLGARGLRSVEFFNTSILNIARAETALALRGSLDLPMSDNVRKAISIAAEVSSGRGHVTSEKIEAAIPFLNDWVFISARWTISLIQMATGYPLWSTKMSFETRAKIFHEIYLKTLIGRALMASAIAALFPPKDDEDLEEFLKRVRNSMGFGNPLDPNYGKLKLKNGFSLDLAQGVSPLTGVFARITTGRTIRDGKSVDLRDEEKGRAIDAYLKNRANMVTASLVRTLITGRAYGGERLPSISRIYRTLEGTEEYPVNGPMLGEVAKEWFAPIILADTKRIYQELGPKGVVLWTTMMSGAGVQAFKPKEKKTAIY